MTQPRILVVDDERIVNLDIQGALARLGYQVAGQASGGEEALALVARTKPDLVLMDIRLSGAMDGAEAALRIAQTMSVPVVFLTAYSDEETMRRALAAAPFGYLLKPYEDRELRGVIELALAKFRIERELRQARKTAEEASQAKAAFLGTLSHELRTPMNGILGMAELLLASPLDEHQRESVEHIKRSALAYTETLNKLLEFSFLESGQGEAEDSLFVLAEVLEKAVGPHRERARRRGVGLECVVRGVPERVFGAAGRLAQILDQLLENALRFTSSGSVRVEVAPHPLCTGGASTELVGLLFQVRDTGCGIAPEKLRAVFDRFSQAGADKARHGCGLALGLAMCQHLVKKLGGQIWAESVPGQGSCFSFTMRGWKQSSCGLSTPDHSLVGARVLVVEDDLVNRMFLTKALERAGARPLAAEDGETALRLLADQPVDAVIMDLRLPGIDGLSITRMLREGRTGARSGIPVIAITADAGTEAHARCMQAGMDDALCKPVDFDTTKTILRGLLSRWGNQARLGAGPGTADVNHDEQRP